MVLELGVAGMSTDESDDEETNPGRLGARIFQVRVPIWRASQLTTILRWLDKMYLLIRKITRTLRGALPRIRVAPDIETEGMIRSQAYANTTGSVRAKFVNDLPKCAYHGTWFDKFVGDGFDLRYTNKQWDLSIDVEVLQYMVIHTFFVFFS